MKSTFGLPGGIWNQVYGHRPGPRSIRSSPKTGLCAGACGPKAGLRRPTTDQPIASAGAEPLNSVRCSFARNLHAGGRNRPVWGSRASSGVASSR
jgi:hypothetical protein